MTPIVQYTVGKLFSSLTSHIYYISNILKMHRVHLQMRDVCTGTAECTHEVKRSQSMLK